MPQSTVDIVKELVDRLNRFNTLSDVLIDELPEHDAIFSVSLSYSRLRFSISKQHVVYFQYTTQHDAPDAATAECYYHNAQKTDWMKVHFAPLATGGMGPGNQGIGGIAKHENPGEAILDENIERYLIVAESIARSAQHCAKGDDYRPGYFSEIIVTPEGITLQQINHMNSRSPDHKKDYSLRNLEFFIPLKPSSPGTRSLLPDDHIGIMRISFSDGSSPNNRACGEKILEKIAEEKSAFLFQG